MMREWGPGEPRTHTPKGLSSQSGRGPALCPGCWVLQRDGVLLHCMRPQLHLIGPVRSQSLSANPLPPEGFFLHILPADYHHCQSWLLHSSCCPNFGSGANLTRLHGGRKLSHRAGKACCRRALRPPPPLPFTTRPSIRLSLLTHVNNIQSYERSEQGHRPLHIHQWEIDSRGSPHRPACVALCRCFLWAKPGQRAAFTVHRAAVHSHLRREAHPLSSEYETHTRMI